MRSRWYANNDTHGGIYLVANNSSARMSSDWHVSGVVHLFKRAAFGLYLLSPFDFTVLQHKKSLQYAQVKVLN